jgi:HPt (histidine-containing phosphotransfer) domain-containing protein
MLYAFKKSHPQVLKQLRGALEAEDFETVHFKAHSLAGIGGNVTADQLREACKALEKATQIEKNRKWASFFPNCGMNLSA